MNVVFVNMPFGSIRPAIGVSLLKGHLDRMGIASRVAYLNVAFAARLGLETTCSPATLRQINFYWVTGYSPTAYAIHPCSRSTRISTW